MPDGNFQPNKIHQMTFEWIGDRQYSTNIPMHQLLQTAIGIEWQYQFQFWMPLNGRK